MHLHTVCTVHPDHTLLSVHGEADVFTAPLLRQALGDALEQADGRHLVVDLCGIDFIDSSGAQPLIEADQILHARRRRLWLACPHIRTGRMLRSIRLMGYFPVLPDAVSVPRCGTGI
ncbi:anti-sigma factor antagonist [Streptomyces sp. NPDC101225]|uniref:anti-sigma factor antagonist n=1 Tax=Streptomyces sp. NPDC101225 TaxID=3366135 RepID=UPI00380F7A47